MNNKSVINKQAGQFSLSAMGTLPPINLKSIHNNAHHTNGANHIPDFMSSQSG